jgi:hypothetical protein
MIVDVIDFGGDAIGWREGSNSFMDVLWTDILFVVLNWLALDD